MVVQCTNSIAPGPGRIRDFRRRLIRRVVAHQLPAVLVALQPLDDGAVFGAYREDLVLSPHGALEVIRHSVGCPARPVVDFISSRKITMGVNPCSSSDRPSIVRISLRDMELSATLHPKSTVRTSTRTGAFDSVEIVVSCPKKPEIVTPVTLKMFYSETHSDHGRFDHGRTDAKLLKEGSRRRDNLFLPGNPHHLSRDRQETRSSRRGLLGSRGQEP